MPAAVDALRALALETSRRLLALAERARLFKATGQ
jgi:hypothetical protein